MGIVVTVVMLLALVVLFPRVGQRLSPAIKCWAAIFILIAGLWNLTYGLQHLQIFWGLAALISGVLMVLSAIVILGGQSDQIIIARSYRIIKPLSVPIIVGLLCCFLLYAITLIQLNLGYPIIR